MLFPFRGFERDLSMKRKIILNRLLISGDDFSDRYHQLYFGESDAR